MNAPLNQLTHSIHSNTWIRLVKKRHCVLLGDTQQFCCDFNHSLSVFCLKSKSLNFNFLFIEILPYKISVTLGSCWYCYSGCTYTFLRVTLYVLSLSHTHSRLYKPHLARHKYIISRRLHWMPLKSFSRETTCILATVISTVSVRVAVTSLPAPLAIIGSARHETERPVTDPGRSCEKSADSDHWLVNRSISNFQIQFVLLIPVIFSSCYYSLQCHMLLNIICQELFSWQIVLFSGIFDE